MSNGKFAGGYGVEGDPYLVEDAWDLDAVRNNLSACYKLINDIDLNIPPFNEGEGWNPIGEQDNEFKGIFDGNGKKIHNLYINRGLTRYVGLFGDISNGVVRDLATIGVYIVGESQIGAITGGLRNQTIIERCFSTGEIIKNNTRNIASVGGITGYLESSRIENSYSLCNISISSGRNIGGIAGYGTSSKINKCFYAGSMTGSNERREGLCGGTGSTSVNSSFWDNSLSNVSGKGTGLTTEQMQSSQAYIDARWTDETLDDTSLVWILKDGEYPKLWFEKAPIYSLIYHNRTYKTWNGREFIELLSDPTAEDYKLHGIKSLSSVPLDVWNEIVPFTIYTYSDEKQDLQVKITTPGSIYQKEIENYQGPGIVETEAESILSTTESLSLSADYTNCVFQYTLDSGSTWHNAVIDEVIDISRQEGTQLKIKVHLPDKNSELNALAYGWA